MQMEDLIRMQRDDEPEYLGNGRQTCESCNDCGVGHCAVCCGRGWVECDPDDHRND